MNELLAPQPKLGKKGLLTLIFFLNMTGPMSIDLYLSGLPQMIVDFNTTESVLNYTLIGFFISFAIGMLFIGPISDKVGRKPILLGGILVYGIASVLCSVAQHVEMLILFRIIQALGAGGMISVSTAMVKDSFSHEERPKIIALLQMLGVFAPTVAPLVGAQIIQFFSWHVTFTVLAFFALIAFIIALFLTETLTPETKLKDSVFRSILSLKHILVHKPFMVFLVSMGGPSVVYMAFLSLSSYIYIDWFQLNGTEYSLFFAVNSLLLLVGPRVYLAVRHQVTPKQIVKIAFGGIVLSSILLFTIGTLSPYLFLIAFAPVTFSNSFLRSFASNVLLGQDNMNSGGAASIINFSNTGLGAMGMMLAALPFGTNIQRLGFVIVIAMALSIYLWYYFNKKGYQLRGV
ncbi:Bcr/CflA family efflux MFS transporter [Flavobacterium agricola]|uniref:Bcr/CflA family efflux MFS transporter n=1 Tax=Flavobacterium agricola TaxID=2870839 RepID=A0ABY6LZF1_9FLAO|nr:Bcr/CflA family efflux MFS transporter [Flavobacterium agricola]UYW01702.1 Bcr/CflA family efflux MFS transporter [Flavobacterium agricola]